MQLTITPVVIIIIIVILKRKNDFMKKLTAFILALLLMFSLAACGKNDPNLQGSGDHYELNVIENDKTITWSAGNFTHVYTHDGKNVTRYTLYINFENVELAQQSLEAYQTVVGSFKKDMKSITRKGTYVVLEYKKSGFPYKTAEEVKAAYNAIKEQSEN